MARRKAVCARDGSSTRGRHMEADRGGSNRHPPACSRRTPTLEGVGAIQLLNVNALPQSVWPQAAQ